MTALLHELFEEQVHRTPDAVATRFRDREMTYSGLDVRSNRLAWKLRSSGVEPGTVTAIAIPRSDLLVVAVLAVLKAGGTYVYVDSSDPADRRSAVVTAAGAAVFLSDGEGDFPAPPVITVDARDEYLEHPATGPRTATSAEQAAYVLFTSGSTGEPKGVLVSHRAVTSYLGWAVEEYGIADGTGALVHTSLGFDLTITSLFGPLVCGGTAVVLPEAEVMAGLARELRSGQDFSVLKLTPSHLLVLNDYLDPERLAGSVRTLIVGGEALRAETLQTWREHAPTTRIVNEYGPTEATVGCCRHWVTPADVTGPVPIGTAAPTTQLYIMDAGGKPVPAGEVGELYVAGSQLANGYLNNAALTSQRFIDLTVGSGEQRRAYRTGDLVRRDEHESLVYVGRNDRQVKVRGYRVELGEIEIALCNEAEIIDAHVIFEDGIISAYVRPGIGTEAVDTSRLSARLSQALPHYMMPSRYIELGHIPLTANGKVDYKRLAALDGIQDGGFLAREEMNKVMLEIWSAILEEEVDDLDLNFFTGGGDSILAVQMVARARERGVPISLQQIFAGPTIRQLLDGIVRDTVVPEADDDLTGILLSLTPEGRSPR
jgi:amino acid adenylation domain-containing protein